MPVLSATQPLRRPRVVRRIAEAAEYPIAVVLAPAGCGKSTALQHYLEELATPYVRYDVRPEHATLLGFVRGLAQALAPVAPAALGSVAGAVRSALESANPALALTAWLREHLPQYDGTIAIDDVHVAEADPRSAAFLVALIEASPPSTRWLVAARGTLHLPVSSWLVYRRCGVPVAEGDLTFTPEEARAAARALSREVGDERAEALREKTGGWATAFALALRLSDARSGEDAAVASRLLSYSYLAEQVYASLADEERELLAFGALLAEFDVEVFERGGFSRARARLGELQRKVTFLSIAPGEGDAPARYRCHDLFRDFLEHELALREEAEAAALRVRAARASYECGQVVPALALYIRAGAAEEAIALLERHAFDLMHQAWSDSVIRAIEALPGAFANRPIVLAIRGLQAHQAGEFARAQAMYERAIEASAEPAFRARVVALCASSMLNARVHPGDLLESAARDETLPVPLRCEVRSLLALSRARFGPYAGIEALWDDVERLSTGVDSEARLATIYHNLGVSARLHGAQARAQRLLVRGAALAVAQGMFAQATTTYAALAASADIAGDREQALRWLERSSDAALKSGSPRAGIHALGGRLSFALRCGSDEELERTLAAYDALGGPEQPNLAATARSARAMLAALQGRFDEAYRLECDALEAQAYLHGFEEARMMALARCAVYLCGGDRAQEALEQVARTLDDAERTSWPNRPQTRLYREMVVALCALATACGGRPHAALRLLQKPAASDEPAGLAMREAVAKVVRDPAATAAAFASERAILERAWLGNYARLLEAIVAKRRGAGAPAAVLTPTERSVLRAIAGGMTPKEIAAANACSVHTVRGHVRALIAKFGCSGRDQAVRIARAQGLV